MNRALIVGADGDEISALARAACTLFGRSGTYMAVELDTSSTDPELAWGTSGPIIRTLAITDTGTAASADAADVAMSGGREGPLGDDGDVAPTILDTARSLGIDVIVIAVRTQGWFARVFSGSAALDLLQTSDIPVLMINRNPSG